MLHETIEEGIAVLTLDDPTSRNAFSPVVRAQLQEALQRNVADAAVRALVLTGAGGHFCAGGNLAQMQVETWAQARARFAETHALVRTLAAYSKPIVAAVQGWAAGAGLSLALLCDTVVAGRGAKFSAPFGRVGLIADLGLLHTLARRIGDGRARQMLLYGEPIEAQDALAIGLIDRMVEDDAVLTVACACARRLSEGAPLPFQLTKQHFLRGLEEVLDWEREVQAALMLTEDHREGRAAFLEKRAAKFLGR